jgi:alkylhydroperoxidase family enzyme
VECEGREGKRSAARKTRCVGITPVIENGVPDELYGEVREHFSERERVGLTLAVVATNGWNRLATSFRSPVGEHQPPAVLRVEAVAS